MMFLGTGVVSRKSAISCTLAIIAAVIIVIYTIPTASGQDYV